MSDPALLNLDVDMRCFFYEDEIRITGPNMSCIHADYSTMA